MYGRRINIVTLYIKMLSLVYVYIRILLWFSYDQAWNWFLLWNYSVSWSKSREQNHQGEALSQTILNFFTFSRIFYRPKYIIKSFWLPLLKKWIICLINKRKYFLRVSWHKFSWLYWMRKNAWIWTILYAL
jgi:hypothetical protein